MSTEPEPFTVAHHPQRYKFDKRTIEATDREWLAYHLTGFNEKV
jgi:uridine phosphorylase